MRVRGGRLPLLLLSLICAATCLGLGHASAQSAPRGGALPNSETSRPTVFTQPELDYLREVRGLSGQAAAERLEQLQLLRDLALHDRDPNFVDLRVLPQSELSVQYLTLAEQIPPDIRSLIEQSGFKAPIDARTVPYSNDQLEAAALKVHEWLGARGSVYGDVLSGQIQAYAPDPENLPDRPRESNHIPVTWAVGEPFTNTLGGGKPWNDCTAGFVVLKTSTLQRGISSNAHCTLSSTYNGQTVIWSGLSGLSGQYDATMFVEYPNGSASWNNGIACCSGISAQINSRVSRSSMAIGDDVCKMGKTTNVTCGDIESKTACHQGSCVWVQVGRGSQNMSSGGDSGGPYWFGGGAYGWNTAEGGPGDLKAIFMAQNYSADLGFIVAIS